MSSVSVWFSAAVLFPSEPIFAHVFPVISQPERIQASQLSAASPIKYYVGNKKPEQRQ